MDTVSTLSKEFALAPPYVQNIIQMLDEGKTIPFIARYRKELTGSADDQTIRALAERLDRIRTLDKRRTEILKSLSDQNVLTESLKGQILSAESSATLEDLYRPYRQKRKTRASIAEEKGLAPLADLILQQQPLQHSLQTYALKFLSSERGVITVDEALQGARDIIAERISNNSDCRVKLRTAFFNRAQIFTTAATDGESPYSMYYEYSEPLSTIPDHRILAINRGEHEGFLRVKAKMDDDLAINFLNRAFIRPNSPTSDQLKLATADAWNRLIEPSIEREVRSTLTDRASNSAIEIFGKNLHHLLMQPPIKGHVTLGVDPGYRTGCKLAVVDASGKVLQTAVAHFTLPGMDRQKKEAQNLIRKMIQECGVTAIAIGNGTASRESEIFIAELLKTIPEEVHYAIVNEAGASVYSASKAGAEEFPQYDVTIRSAISIARRLQDPLAELVKIDPQSIGVGQYQHDLKETDLKRKLAGVVEDCVNAVGVELSTASAALLEHVAGIGPILARNIVAYRNENGFSSRNDLKKVPKLGPKAFEQSAGFLRLVDSANYLDSTAIHPESYSAAKALIEHFGYRLEDLKHSDTAQNIYTKAEAEGAESLAKALNIGIPTLRDILSELIKPGRDPREDLPRTILRSDVLEMNDLQKGMKLQGTVRNVIDFGAFVDIGVHQDGLVHISRMSRKFIKHPSEVVKVGDVVDVWVLDVDKQKKRIALSMIENA